MLCSFSRLINYGINNGQVWYFILGSCFVCLFVRWFFFFQPHECWERMQGRHSVVRTLSCSHWFCSWSQLMFKTLRKKGKQNFTFWACTGKTLEDFGKEADSHSWSAAEVRRTVLVQYLVFFLHYFKTFSLWSKWVMKVYSFWSSSGESHHNIAASSAMLTPMSIGKLGFLSKVNYSLQNC